MEHNKLSGVYAAAITPLKADGSLDLDGIPQLLDFLAQRGCHGALLLGTTGEGPSFATEERREIWCAATKVGEQHPDFRLLAGTGTPSLPETTSITRTAFDLGFDGVVVLPPYYFSHPTLEGLFRWYSEVIYNAVPMDGALLAYHIPQTSGVPIELDLLARLKNAFPKRFAGLKDSSGDPEHAHRLGTAFGDKLLILNGNDRLFSLALEAGARGGITALGNLLSPDLRAVWDAHQHGKPAPEAQAKLTAARKVSDRNQPAAPLIKALLARWHHFPRWTVRPPLVPLPTEKEDSVADEFAKALGGR